MKEAEVRGAVREAYARIAEGSAPCCSDAGSTDGAQDVTQTARSIGYTDEQLSALPDGANLGLGCGNPVALGLLREGDVVLDLGSGGGIDCFLAAQCVEASGRVIGIDMTPEMLDRARSNAAEGGYTNVEFRLGEIEALPVADSSVDVVISNCVICLSPDKERVFREVARVLKPGGRLAVSDIVLLRELPASVREAAELYASCIPGAALKEEYLAAMNTAGPCDVTVVDETPFPAELVFSDGLSEVIVRDLRLTPEDLAQAASSAVSIKVTARASSGIG